jgi:signal transduction histidine kinase
LLGDLNNFTSDYRTAEANSLLAANARDLESGLEETRQLDQAILRAQRGYEKIPHDPEEAALYRNFSETWAQYKTIAEQVTALSSAGRNSEAAAIYRTRSRLTYDAASDMLGRLTGYNVAAAARASERSDLAYQQARWLMGAALAGSGLMLAIVITQVRRQVSLPLLDLGGAMHRLAANDTSVEIGYTGRNDEIGEMAHAVTIFRANAIELMQSQKGLAQQATMLEEKLTNEQTVTQMQRNFVSMITHEFRTPLTQIDAQAQRLGNLKDRLQPDDIGERASKIRAAVRRIIRMIDHLVDTTRLTDGDPNLYFHPQPMDLVRVLRDVCRLQREISPGALIIEDFLAPSAPMAGDPKLLSQAFGNLVANAVKYSSSDVRVVLRLRQTGERLTVTVEDAGIGIPPKDIDRIFDRYYRGSNVSGFVGSGIGLFLVSTVLRLHNGDIAVESTEGIGTRFTVSLPAAPYA